MILPDPCNSGNPRDALECLRMLAYLVEEYAQQAAFSLSVGRLEAEYQAREALAELHRLGRRSIDLGPPPVRTGYPGGLPGWTIDVRDALGAVTAAAEEVLGLALHVPKLPCGDEITPAISEAHVAAVLAWQEGKRRLEDRCDRLWRLNQQVGDAPAQEAPARQAQAAQQAPPPGGVKQPDTLPCYVTLDQMAAMIPRSKRTLERLKKRRKNPLPTPDVEGGGGKADEWEWVKIRPWLEEEFRRQLPEHFPANRASVG
jgi:hypothetical protein